MDGKRGLNKKAQGLSTSTIVLLIIGVLILVILILGFSVGWQKLFPFISTDNNVDQVSQACQLACSSRSPYDFCSKERTIKIGGDETSGSCADFAPEGDSYNPDFAIETCSEITCP